MFRILDDRGARPVCRYLGADGSEIPVRIADPSRVYRFVDRIYLLLSLAALGGCWLPFVVTGHLNPLGSCLLLIVTGFALWIRGRKSRPTVRELVDDRRPPNLYLRAFSDDSSLLRETLSENGGLDEAELTEGFARSGPLLAVGRPREPLPPDGAWRIYVEDEFWQDLVADLLQRSNAVIIRPGFSDGLRWELIQSFRKVKPNRLLLYFQVAASLPHRRQGDYREFREHADPAFQGRLPLELGDTPFIYFLSDGQPVALRYGQTTFVDKAETDLTRDDSASDGCVNDPDSGAGQVERRKQVGCPNCGAAVVPTFGGDCPACREPMPAWILEGNTQVHPLQAELRRLAAVSDFAKRQAPSTKTTERLQEMGNRRIRFPIPQWVRRGWRNATTRTFHVRALIGNAMALLLISIIVLVMMFAGPPIPRKNRFARMMRAVSRHLDRDDQPSRQQRNEEAFRQGRMPSRSQGVTVPVFRSQVLRPSNPDPIDDVGKSYLEDAKRAMIQDDNAAAEESLQKALKRCPDSSSALVQAGRLYERQMRYDDAEQAYRKAIALEQSSVPTSALAQLLIKQKRFEEAKVVYQEGIKGGQLGSLPTRMALDRLEHLMRDSKDDSDRQIQDGPRRVRRGQLRELPKLPLEP